MPGSAAEPPPLYRCAFGEGAAVAIVASEDAIERLSLDRSRATRVAASKSRSEKLYTPGVIPDMALTEETAAASYTRARVTPSDLGIGEMHEAFTIEEIPYTEVLGLCASSSRPTRC